MNKRALPSTDMAKLSTIPLGSTSFALPTYGSLILKREHEQLLVLVEYLSKFLSNILDEPPDSM